MSASRSHLVAAPTQLVGRAVETLEAIVWADVNWKAFLTADQHIKVCEALEALREAAR